MSGEMSAFLLKALRTGAKEQTSRGKDFQALCWKALKLQESGHNGSAHPYLNAAIFLAAKVKVSIGGEYVMDNRNTNFS
jgi:hypothetical protein